MGFFLIHFKVRGRPNEVRHVREKRADVEQISNDTLTLLCITGFHTVGVFVLLTRNLSDWISLLRWVYFVWFSVPDAFLHMFCLQVKQHFMRLCRSMCEADNADCRS